MLGVSCLYRCMSFVLYTSWIRDECICDSAAGRDRGWGCGVLSVWMGGVLGLVESA